MFSTILRPLCVIIIICFANILVAQDQVGIQQGNSVGSLNITSFLIEGNPAPDCQNSQNSYWVRTISEPHTDVNPNEVSTFFAIPGGSGDQSFTVKVAYAYPFSPACGPPSYSVLINGEVCFSCSIEVEQLSFTPCNVILGTGSSGVDRIRITHQAGNAWDLVDGVQNGVQEFSLRLAQLGVNAEIRFGAVAVGTSYTDVLGYFDAPQAPLFILRDPPGDASYSSLTTSNSTCFGQTFSVTTDQSASAYYKAKLGVKGSVGIVVETEYEIFAELTGSLTAGRTETEDREYQTCLETTETYSTSETGSPEDVFVGSAIRYAYGVGLVVERPSCNTVIRDARFAMTPVELLSSYTLPESVIRENTIPNLQNQVDTLDQDSQDYKDALNQLNVWIQTLAMNDSIKAVAPEAVQRQFSSGSPFNWELTQSTSKTLSVDMNVYLEGSLSFDFGFYFGGSGVGFGGELKMRNEYGSGQSSSNSSTNTMAYHLQDDQGEGDIFNVIVGRDSVFGTYTFRLDSAVSRTSCPYEGGYQVDQPDLGVQSIGQSTMTLTNVPEGSSAVFPLYICNNSQFERTYHLKYNANTNTEGALLQVLGNPLTNDDGIELPVPANNCLSVANLLLTEPVSPIGPDYEIDLYLYSLCEPAIRSTITVVAQFDRMVGVDGSAGTAKDWFTVSPNPSNAYFQLLNRDPLGTTSFMVMDATGRSVKAPFDLVGTGTYNLDLSDVAPGMYFLLANRAGDQRSMKLIVQR